MKKRCSPGLFSAVLLALVPVLLAQGSAKGGRCTDIPISVTFLGTTAAPAAIWNDIPNSAYQNGVDGVSAVINRCSGTYDATLHLNRSRRTVSMQFPSAVPNSIIVGGPPAFAGGVAFQAQGGINIRNITGYGTLTPSTAATFYTRVGRGFTGPDGKSYGLNFHPDDSACPGQGTPIECVSDLLIATYPWDMNQPAEAAWVLVTYTPAAQPWSKDNADQWIVDGELLLADTVYERATLHQVQKNGGTVHYGQYSMPFKVLIKALAPLQ